MRLFERVIIDSRCRRHSFVVCRPRVSRALLFGKSWGHSQTETYLSRGLAPPGSVTTAGNTKLDSRAPRMGRFVH